MTSDAPRWWARASPRRLLRDAPVSGAYLLTLAVTTTTLASGGGREVRGVVESASTNLANMTHHPVHALVVSAFWVEQASELVPMALLVLLVMAAVERRWGPGRTVLVMASAHVGATVATVAGTGVGIGLGLLPRHLTRVVDVGPSYGLLGAAGFLTSRVQHRWARRGVAGTALAALVAVAAVSRGIGDVGHVLSLVIGLALGPVVGGRGRTPAPGSAPSPGTTPVAPGTAPRARPAAAVGDLLRALRTPAAPGAPRSPSP